MTKIKIELTLKGTEIIERAVSKFGTGAHVIVPKEYAGKRVKVIIDEIPELNEKRVRNKN